MKHNRVTYCILLLLIVPSVVFLYRFSDKSKATKREEPSFIIKSEENIEERIEGYWLGDTLLVYLPSFAKVQDIDKLLNINRVNSKWGGVIIKTVQSEHTPTLFVDTYSGGTKIIHKTKLYSENSRVRLYSADGKLEYESKTDTIKSRGNTSWNADKKPYMISMTNPHSVLGMPASGRWILLASPYDETCMRNKIVYDFAGKTGLEWTPRCEYIDLVLNGEYRGLYLISEKVEYSVNRLPLRKYGFNYLCTMDLLSRCQNQSNKELVTQVGQGIRIRYPMYCNPVEWHRIHDIVQSFDNALIQNDTSSSFGRDWPQYADLESWARKYMIDEIFGNFDAGLASYFFYCSGDDTDYTIYGGPIWDYDGAINLNAVLPKANSFLARRSWRSQSPNAHTPWYNGMYKTPEFRAKVSELYRSEYRPLLNELIDDGIENMFDSIEKAVDANNTRWRQSLSSDYVQSFGVKNHHDIIQYLSVKRDFLDSAWLFNREVCFVQIEKSHEAEYTCYSVWKGQPFESFIEEDSLNVIVNRETGVKYNGEPIEGDVQFILKRLPGENEVKETKLQGMMSKIDQYRHYILVVGVLFFFVMVLLLFAIIDRKRAIKE